MEKLPLPLSMPEPGEGECEGWDWVRWLHPDKEVMLEPKNKY